MEIDIKNNSILKCPVCGSDCNSEKNFTRISHYKKWDLYECPKCTFQFWWPMEQANCEWWENTYDAYKSLDKKSYLEPRHKNLFKKMPLKKGKILDIGCGEGGFLYEMNKRGFDTYGIDLNKWAIRKAKKLFGLKNTEAISIYNFASRQDKFEFITFFEVLEHIGNPKEFIEIIKKLLNDKGFICFSVPDAKIYGPFEESQNLPPYHFNRYNSQALKRFLINNGFEICIFEKISRLDSICFLNNILMKLLGKNFSPNKHNRNILSLWRYISFPLREFLYILGFRSTFFVIAQLKSDF